MVVPTSLAPVSQQGTSSAPQGIGFSTSFIPPPTVINTPSGLMTTQAGAVVVREYSGPRIVSETVVTPEVQKAKDVSAINQNVAAGGKYSATVIVSTAEQVQDVRTWAADKGYEVRRQPNTTGEATATLRIVSKQPIPKDVNIPVRSVAAIKEERIARYSREVGIKTYESANPLEQFILKEGARLSPSGYELAVAPIAGLLGGKTEAQAVGENIATILSEDYAATYKGSLQGGNPILTVGPPQGEILPFVPIPAVTPSYGGVVGRYFQSPTFAVQSALMGGFGLSGIGATATGAKILYSVPGQVAGVALTAYSGGAAAYETYTLAASGDTSKALGVGAISALSFGAAYGAFKAGEAGVRAKLPVEADYSRINAVSVTKTEGTVTRSFGRSEVTEGYLKGLKINTKSLSGETYGTLQSDIAAQILPGGRKVTAMTFTDATQSYSSGKVSVQKVGSYAIQGPEGIMGVGGERQTVSMGIETSRENRGPLVFRTFEGVARTSKGTYDLIGVKQGDRMAFVDSLNVKKAGVIDFTWRDISGTGVKAEPLIKPFKEPPPGPSKPYSPEVKPSESTLPKPIETPTGKGSSSLLLEPAKPQPDNILTGSKLVEPVRIPDLGSVKVEPINLKAPPIVTPLLATKQAEAVSQLRIMASASAVRLKGSEDSMALIGRSGIFTPTDTTQKTDIITITTFDTPYKLTTAETFKTPTPEDPWRMTAPPGPETPFIPGIPGIPTMPLLPGLGFGRVFGRGSVGRRKTAYKPNILGIFLGGKAPKGQLSGIEPRPFPLAKREKPKKAVRSDRASVRRYFGI